jgi:TPP-dependent pyruvate/acetoin dehydrogenase alpha subunit
VVRGGRRPGGSRQSTLGRRSHAAGDADVPPLWPLQVERWLARDPVKLTRARLLEEGIPEADVAGAEQQVRAALDQAVANALAAPYPDPAEATATEYAP